MTECRALDNLITGSLDNMRPSETDPDFTFDEADVTPARSTIDGPVDCVMHMASLASPKDYLAHPSETLGVRLDGDAQHAGTRARERAPRSCLRAHRSATAIRWSIRRRNRTGAT